jgi:hypothetical protein
VKLRRRRAVMADQGSIAKRSQAQTGEPSQ